MQVNIAAATVIRCDMKHGIDALHCGARNTRFTKICLQELYFASGQLVLQVSQRTAGEVVHDANFLDSSFDEAVRQRGTDKRRTAGDKNSFATPESFFGH